MFYVEFFILRISFFLCRDVDQVHELMDDIQEQQEIANEISEAISNPVGFGTDVDDDELLKELEEMEEAEVSSKLLDAGTVSQEELPAVPASDLPSAPSASKKKVPEDDDLAELAQWAS